MAGLTHSPLRPVEGAVPEFQFGAGAPQRPTTMATIFLPINHKTLTHISFNVFLLPLSRIPLLLGKRFMQKLRAVVQFDPQPCVSCGYFSVPLQCQPSDFCKTPIDQNFITTDSTDFEYALPVSDDYSDKLPKPPGYPDNPGIKQLIDRLTSDYPKYTKLWHLSYSQICTLHGQRHVGPDQTLNALKFILPETLTLSKDVTDFFRITHKRLTLIRQNCSVCNKHKRGPTHPSLLSDKANLVFNQKVSMDTINGGALINNHWFLIIDHCTGFVRIFPYLGQLTAEVAFSEFLIGWASIFGPPSLLLPDREGGFLGAATAFESLGTTVQFRPSGSHAPAGRAERAVQTVRQIINTDEEFLKTADFLQIRLWTAQVENSINNAVQKNVGNAALRTLGFTSSLEFNAITDSRLSAFSNHPTRTSALDAYKRVCTSDSFRRTLKSSDTSGAEKLFDPGTKVWIHVHTAGGKTESSRQPGIVLAFDADAMTYQCQTASGGVVSIGRRDLTLMSEIAEDSQLGTSEIAKQVTDVLEPIDKVDNGANITCPRCRNRRSKKAHTRTTGCNLFTTATLAVDVLKPIEKIPESKHADVPKPDENINHVPNNPDFCEGKKYNSLEFLLTTSSELYLDYENIFTVQEMNKYQIEWDDLDPEERKRALKSAEEIYFKNGVWSRDHEMSDKDFREYEKQSKTKIIKVDATVVTKAKLIAAEGSSKKLIGKARIAIRGFKDRTSDHSQSDAPTANPSSTSLAEFFGLRLGLRVCAIDFENAFFKIDDSEIDHLGGEVWCKVPLLLTGGRSVWRRCLKDAQGMRGAARSWYNTISNTLCNFGFVVSENDPALFLYWSKHTSNDGEESTSLEGILSLHVDDGRLWASPSVHKSFISYLKSKNLFSDYNFGYSDPKCEDPCFAQISTTDFLGCIWTVDYGSSTSSISQDEYIKAKLHPLKLSKEELKNPSLDLSGRVSEFLGAMGSLIWVTKTQKNYIHEASYLAGRRNHLTVEDFQMYNTVISNIRRNPAILKITGFAEKIKMVVITDGSETSKKTSAGYVGRIIGFQPATPPGEVCNFTPIVVRGGKSPRATHSSYDVESVSTIIALDECYGLATLAEEFLKPPAKKLTRFQRRSFFHSGVAKINFYIEIHTDCELLVRGVRSLKRVDPLLGGRRREDVNDLKEAIQSQFLSAIFHVAGVTNPADRLTKLAAKCLRTGAILLNILTENLYSPDFS